MIILNSKAQLTVDIIAKVAESRLTVADAAKLLNKSRRTIERYLQRYREQGLHFAVHGNTGTEPANKTSNTIKNQVQNLIREKYFDLNLLHLAELLQANEQILVRRETLRKWAHEIHHVKRSKRRRTRIHKRRERMNAPGLMLQMDGSTHRWFGKEKSCLIAIIDDANSELHAQFFPSETTEGCLKVMRTVIEKRGIFRTLYVDRAGIFGGPKRCNFSQMQRACEELGIEIIFANTPQGKGRIERAFDTLQDRLIPELRLHKITDMLGANGYLQHVFLPQFWQTQLMVKASTEESEYAPLPKVVNLDDICTTKIYRKIRNDHTFSYGNNFYFIESPIKHSIANQKIEIRKGNGEDFSAYFAGRQLRVSKVVEPTKLSVDDLAIQQKLEVLALADRLGNVAEASRLSGVSRDTIYRHRRLLKAGGTEALRRQEAQGHRHKNRACQSLEELVVDFSLKNPHLGQSQVSRQLKEKFETEISAGGVRSIWLRADLNTMAMRLTAIKNLNEVKRKLD